MQPPDAGTPLENFTSNIQGPLINPNRFLPGFPQQRYTPNVAIMGLMGRGPLSMRGERGALYGTETGRERLQGISDTAMRIRGQSPVGRGISGAGQGAGFGGAGDYMDALRKLLQQRGVMFGG